MYKNGRESGGYNEVAKLKWILDSALDIRPGIKDYKTDNIYCSQAIYFYRKIYRFHFEYYGWSNTSIYNL